MTETDNQIALPNGSRILFYELIEKLGQGAFGMTYLALDTHRNRPVVLKEYFPSNAAVRTTGQTQVSLLSHSKQDDFDEGLRRFRREAQVLSEFDHPNVVKVIGLFDANGTAYFVMEHVEGQSLEDLLKSTGNRAFTETEIQKNVLPMLNGLEAVHNKALLHLDIKPDNILTSKYGQPLLIDFGGARYSTSQASQDHSSMVATHGYAPPEQYSLKQQQTAATDIYAVGITLYHMMAPGVEIPDSKDRQTAYQDQLPDPLPPIRDVARGYSEALYNVVDACTRLSKVKRPQSIDEVKQLLAGTESSSPDTNYPALDALIEIAGADGVITQAEMDTLLAKGRSMGLGSNVVQNCVVRMATLKGWHIEGGSTATGAGGRAAGGGGAGNGSAGSGSALADGSAPYVGMDETQWFIALVKRSFRFYGRANRQEFWMYQLVYWVMMTVALIWETLNESNTYAVTLSLLVFLGLSSLTVTIRRLHDVGKTGWLYLTTLIPYVNLPFSIYLLYLMCQKSEEGSNKYGSLGPSVFAANAGFWRETLNLSYFFGIFYCLITSLVYIDYYANEADGESGMLMELWLFFNAAVTLLGFFIRLNRTFRQLVAINAFVLAIGYGVYYLQHVSDYSELWVFEVMLTVLVTAYSGLMNIRGRAF